MMRLKAQLRTASAEARRAEGAVATPTMRALLTLLEGVAPWNGSQLSVAIAVERGSPSWLDSGLFGDELWLGESQLVRYEGRRPRPSQAPTRPWAISASCGFLVAVNDEREGASCGGGTAISR